MAGKIYWDKNGKRYKIHVHVNGKLWRVWKDPVNAQPFLKRWQAEAVAAGIKREDDEAKKQGCRVDMRQWVPDAPLGFSKYALSWLEGRKGKMSKTAFRNYKSALVKHAMPYFGNSDIRKMKAKPIRLFYESLSHYSQVFSADVMAVVRTMLNDAYRDEDIPRCPPFPRISKGGAKVVEYLTLAQQETIIAAIPERHRPVFEFGMEYGLRTQEVTALKKDCIQNGQVTIKRKFSGNELHETTKTGDLGIRTFTLTTYAIGILERIQPHLGQFVFVSTNGKPYTGTDLNEIWHKAENRTGIKIKLYNAMRHSLGCQLLDSGTDIEKVRQIYGHTKIEMTMRYVRRQVTQGANDALEARRGKVVEIKRKAE